MTSAGGGARPASSLGGLGLAGGAKLVVSLIVLAAGFRAVSDDDYARLVIAQRFAEAPSLDPSGTSWLPAPFWAYGAIFWLAGPSVEWARALAIVLGVAATLGVWLAGRWFGASQNEATLGALLAATAPWSVWLGAAPLPEVPTAALIVLGMAGLAGGAERRRLLGALALFFACFCRYEAWPVAAVFALLTSADAVRSRSRTLILATLLAVAAPASWLLHGAVRHGDALFFWRRVASYKEALGASDPLVERALSPLVDLFAGAPLLWLAALLVAFVAGPRNVVPALRRHARAGLAAAALFAFLVAGEASGGAPTHHGARALLPLWFLLAVLLGPLLDAWLGTLGARAVVGGVAAASVALASLPGTRPSDFAERREELELGRAAATLGARRLIIETPDYGYFAVTAGFGRPSLAIVVDDHDPRRSRSPRANPPRQPGEAAGTLWVTTQARARELGAIHRRGARLVLAESN